MTTTNNEAAPMTAAAAWERYEKLCEGRNTPPEGAEADRLRAVIAKG